MTTALGLDIGNHSIKFVELRHGGKVPELVSYGILPAPSKNIFSEAALDQEHIAETIKKLFHDYGAKTREVNLALPDSRVFTRVIEVPHLSEKELANSIQWEAEQYIPMPLDEVEMDFSILREITNNEGVKKLELLLVAAPKNLIERYDSVLEKAGLTAAIMETDVMSVARALVPSENPKQNVMVVNMGASTTTFAILKSGIIAFTRSIEVGGLAMTRSVAQDLGFESAQAEEYKKTYGMEKDKLEGKVYKSIETIYVTILDEIKRGIAYFQQRFPEDRISSLILTGGSAGLPGLVTGLAESLSIEVQVGQPWQHIAVDQKKFPHAIEHGVLLSVACGLALRLE